MKSRTAAIALFTAFAGSVGTSFAQGVEAMQSAPAPIVTMQDLATTFLGMGTLAAVGLMGRRRANAGETAEEGAMQA